jgi:hypothetical protein
MIFKNRILVAALALGTLTVPLMSEARVYVDVNVAPPPPRVEVVPPARVGYVWAPGYWRWNGHKHVRAHGYWVRGRPGYRYEPHAWVQQNGHWHFQEGGWRH